MDLEFGVLSESKTTLPLAFRVTTFLNPSTLKVWRKASIFARFFPPTFIPRRSATYFGKENTHLVSGILVPRLLLIPGGLIGRGFLLQNFPHFSRIYIDIDVKRFQVCLRI